MQHIYRRCKHCNKEYLYCTYGNGPEWGTEEYCSMDYCGENTTIARICFSSSMSGAYRAITDIKDHGDWCYYPLYVHVPENIVDVIKNKNVIIPHKDLVFDQEYTNEHWVREKVKLKCIGKAWFKLGRYNYAGPFRTPVKIKWIEKYD